MAMGDLRTPAVRMGSRPSGAFRGSTSVLPLVQVHRHGSGDAPNLGAVVESLTTSKSIDGSPGTFQFTFKAGNIVGPGFIEIRNNDWVRLGVEAEGRQWLAMIGLVDNINRSIESADGAQDDTWTVSGRDITKVLTDTDMLMAMHAGYDVALAYATFYGAVNALSVIGTGSPGQVVRSLYEYMMQAGSQRVVDNPPIWKVPDSLPLPFETARGRIETYRRQASDIIQDRISNDVEGKFSAYGSLLARPNSGGQVWSILQDHANPVLNELWIDLAPPLSLSGSALAFADSGLDVPGTSAGTGETEFKLAPAIFLRERPFPTVKGGDGAWKSLPTTIVDMSDVVSASLSRGNERYTYFLVESGGGLSFSAMVMAQAALAAAGGELFEGVPAIDRDAIPLHGVQRLEQTSTYINETDGALDIYVGWTLKLRDWYALNPLFSSGTLELGFVAPGIRVGERLIVSGLLLDNEREFGGGTGGEIATGEGAGGVEFYVQEVEHKIQVGGGVTQHNTTLTLTRGIREPLSALAGYVKRYEAKSPLPAKEDNFFAAAARPVVAAAVGTGEAVAAAVELVVQGLSGAVTIPAGAD